MMCLAIIFMISLLGVSDYVPRRTVDQPETHLVYMSDMYYHLYKLTSPTGNVYVGQTRELKRRMSFYRRYHCVKQPHIMASLNQYGWEAHSMEIIAEGEMTQEQINDLEIAEIAKYKAKGISLNVCDGGLTPTPKYGKNNSCSIPVVQFSLEGTFIREWASVTEAGRDLGICGNNIGIAIRRNSPHAYAFGFMWLTRADYDSGVKPLRYDKLRGRTDLRAVVQLDLNGNLIAYHRMIAEAAASIGVAPNAINNVLSGITNQSGGFIWCDRQRYDQGYRPAPVVPYSTLAKPVVVFDLDGNVVGEYRSITEAAKATSICNVTIRRHCQGVGKKSSQVPYTFRFKDVPRHLALDTS